jgi:hypothetical protein
MLPQRHNRTLFHGLLLAITRGAWRVRGEVDAATGKVKFDGASLLGPSWRRAPKFRRGIKGQVNRWNPNE